MSAVIRVYNKSFVVKDIGLHVPAQGTWGQLTHGTLPEGVDEPIPATYKARLKDEIGHIYEATAYPPVWHRWLLGLFDYVTEYRLPRGRIEYYYVLMNNPDDGEKIEVRIPYEDREDYTKYPTIFAHFTPNSLFWIYGNYIQKSRAFSDSYPPEVGGYDVGTDRNYGSRPYDWNCAVFTTGNIYEIVGDEGGYHRVRVLSLAESPPSYEYAFAQGLIKWATEISPFMIDDKHLISSFPQCEVALESISLPKMGTPHPAATKDGFALIEKSRMKILQNEQAYSPYYPEKP